MSICPAENFGASLWGGKIQFAPPIRPICRQENSLYPTSCADVELREITADTVRRVCEIAVAERQRGFVAANALSIAQAHFEPRHWMRAICVGDEVAGFVLTKEDRQQPLFYLWRFMVDARYQRRGVGRQAMELLLDRWRGLGAQEGVLSVVEDNHGAIAFYKSLGFRLTGELAGGELVMRLQL
jgi:diamine N-acetyltransferase